MSRFRTELVTDVGLRNADKIRALAKARGRDTETLLRRFVLEAAIRRIFASHHADRFGVSSLKGGSLMFFSEGVDVIDGRATSDIDLQFAGFDGTPAELLGIMREVLADVPVFDDGVRFDIEQLRTGSIRGGEGFVPGCALVTAAQVGKSVVAFKADTGFYAAEHAADLEVVDFPSVLPGVLQPIRIYRQPIEYAIADKVHAAAKHGTTNTRLRDFYDLFVFCTRCTIDEDRLVRGFQKWPALFNTAVPSSMEFIGAYSDRFAEQNAVTWKRTRDASAWAVPAPDLATVVRTIKETFEPAIARAAQPGVSP